MAAYRTAARMFPGLHQPLLGMALEYARMNNMELAEQLARQAYQRCPWDPLLCHELGVLAFRSHKLDEAKDWFHNALQHMPGGCPTAGPATPINPLPCLCTCIEEVSVKYMLEARICRRRQNPSPIGSLVGFLYDNWMTLPLFLSRVQGCSPSLNGLEMSRSFLTSLFCAVSCSFSKA
jgi:hypothetical protein